MKKTKTVITCDICGENSNDDDDDLDDDDDDDDKNSGQNPIKESSFKECVFCKNDVCHDCYNDFPFNFNGSIKDVVCTQCLKESELEKEMKKFARKGDVKKQLDIYTIQLKEILYKIVMVKNIKSGSKNEQK
jgi:hypothetical protein